MAGASYSIKKNRIERGWHPGFVLDGDGTLRPRATLSRAETASLMHRLMTMPGSAG